MARLDHRADEDYRSVDSPHAVTELAPWLLALSDQLIDAIIETARAISPAI
jgi:hypothetical protein